MNCRILCNGFTNWKVNIQDKFVSVRTTKAYGRGGGGLELNGEPTDTFRDMS